MSYDVRLLGAAERDLKALFKKLDGRGRRRLEDALADLRDDPMTGDVTLLVGSNGLFRRRVGDYRVVFALREQVLIVVVVLVGDRKQVYDVLDRRDFKVLGLSDAELLKALSR